MGVVHESFWSWRVKFLIPAIVIFLMLISVLRRHILPLFFALLVVVSFARPSSAVTWDDVVIAWGGHTPAAGCIDFVSKYTQDGQTGYQLWSRCNSSTVLSYKKKIQGTGTYTVNGWANPYNCVGDNTQNGSAYQNYYAGAGPEYTHNYYCDGHTAITEYASSKNTVAQNCWWGTMKSTGGYISPSDPTIGSNCASLDTLIQDFFPVVNNCTYMGVEVYGPGGTTGMTYSSQVPDDGSVNVCNQCIPAGMIPSDDPAHNTPASFDDSIYLCRWQDVVGDPAKPLDPFVPPASGGGAVAPSGGSRPLEEGSSISESSISDGVNTETTKTETTTTVNSDGSTTTTKTESLTYCIDLDADGISDISGRKCAEVKTETVSSMPVSTPSLDQKAAYSNVDLPSVGDFGSLFSAFFADVRASQMFSTFTLSGLAPSGSGSPSYTLDFGSYGTHDFDFSNYSTAFNIIKGFMLLLASYLAVRVVVLKR